MPELSTDSAGKTIGTSGQTIRRLIDRELLPARREGLRGIIRIEVDSLKEFATKYGYRFNDELAANLAEN